jgi:hypothetical protein
MCGVSGPACVGEASSKSGPPPRVQTLLPALLCFLPSPSPVARLARCVVDSTAPWSSRAASSALISPRSSASTCLSRPCTDASADPSRCGVSYPIHERHRASEITQWWVEIVLSLHARTPGSTPAARNSVGEDLRSCRVTRFQFGTPTVLVRLRQLCSHAVPRIVFSPQEGGRHPNLQCAILAV